MKQYYKQCTLTKRLGPTTTRTQIAWIPEKFVIKGKVLKIKDHNDEWENGWVVMSDGGARKEEKQLPDYRSMIRGHRRQTGDALPKESA